MKRILFARFCASNKSSGLDRRWIHRCARAYRAGETIWTKSFIVLCFFIPIALLSSACSSVQRSNASGYGGASLETNSPRERRDQRLNAAADKLGFEDPSNLSDSELRRVHQRAQLDRAEQILEGRRERDQYFSNKPYMKDDRDRLAFLALPDFEAREKWLDSRHIDGSSTPNSPVMQNIVDQNDVAVGMTKQAVRDSWGPPDSVEVAGNPIYGNEKWMYSEQTASTEGYRNEKRAIFFEAGRVVGWETR